MGDSFLNDMPKLHECTIDKRTGEPVSQSSLKAAEKKRSIYIRKVLNGNKDWTQQEPEAVELCMRLAERDVPEFAYCVASNGGGTKGEGAWKSRRFVKLGFEGLVRKKRVRGKKAVQAAQEVKDEDVQPRAGKGKGRAREVESASEAAEDDEEMFDGDEDEVRSPSLSSMLTLLPCEGGSLLQCCSGRPGLLTSLSRALTAAPLQVTRQAQPCNQQLRRV